MRKLLQLVALLAILQSCANQSQPTGGPKDEDPPRLLESTPVQGQRNFTSREFTLVFDEEVTLNNPKNQLLITPRTSVEYDIDYRRNVVTLKFDSALDANTTYTLSFRQSIVDITEKNPAQNLQIAFSTGPELDTLILEGNVKSVLTGATPAGATVVLYRETDTTDIFTGLPYYFTETSDSGKFSLNNLKHGVYRVYAINDYNANLKAESGSEPYAFYSEPVIIDSANLPIQLMMVNLDLDSLRNLSARQSGSSFLVKYNKAIVDYTLESPDSIIAYMDVEDPSLIRVQTTASVNPGDSTFFTLMATDSLLQTVSQDLYGKFDPLSTRKEPYSLRIQSNPVLVKNPVLQYKLKFSKPSRIANEDSLFIRIDSLHIYKFNNSHLTWNKNNTELSIDYVFDKSLFQRQDTAQSQDSNTRRGKSVRETPTFQIGQGAFVSIEYDTIKHQQQNLQFFTSDDVSLFTLELSNVPGYPVLIQILSSASEIVFTRTVAKDGTYTFTNITPASYSIRIIHDRNANGKWDPGNYLLGEQPEKIHIVTDKSGADVWNLRANFEFQESIDLNVN